MRTCIRAFATGETLYELPKGCPVHILEMACREGVNLAYADLSGLNLRRLNLFGLKAPFANFAYSTFNEVCFEEADLFCANFETSYIAYSSFNEADLRYVDFSGCRVTKTSFDKALTNEMTKLPRGTST